MIDDKKCLAILQMYHDIAHKKWKSAGNEQEQIGLMTEMHYIDLGIRFLKSQPKVSEWKPFIFGFDNEIRRKALIGEIPDDDQDILVTDGEDVWLDTFFNDGDLCYLDSNAVPGSEVKAWMPLPEPPKGEQE